MGKKAESGIVARLYDRFFELYSARASLGIEEKWKRWEAQSLPGDTAVLSGSNDSQDHSDLNIKDSSKLRSPMTWSTIQTVVALSVDQDTEVELLPESDEDRHKTLVLTDILDHEWERANGDIEREYLVQEACRLGTGIWKEYYRTDTRKIKNILKWNPATEEMEYEEQDFEEYNAVYGKTIDIRSFYVDQMATSMEDARDCFERMVIPFESFQQLYPTKKYPNADKVKPGHHFLAEFLHEDTEFDLDDIGEDEVEVMEYWNKIKDERHIVANGVLLTPEISPIPYKHKQLPYARYVLFFRRKKDFYGIGIPEILEHHQAGRDTIWNIMLDRMKLSLNKPTFISPNTDLTDEDLEIYPGKTIEVPDPATSVREMQIDPPDANSFNVIDKIDTEAKYLIGADDPMYGVKTGGTATENAIAKDASLRKMKVVIRHLEAGAMARIGRLRLANIQQFYSVPVRIKKIVGKTLLGKLTSGLPLSVQESIPGKKEQVELVPVYRKFPINKKKIKNSLGRDQWVDKPGTFAELKPEDYMGVFDVRVVPTANLTISKELERKQFLEMITDVSRIPQIAAITNWTKVGEDLYWKYNVNSDKYIIDQVSQRQKLIDLAVDENERMIEGEPVPFTRGATVEHSQRHEALIFSKDFKEFDLEIQNMIIRHYAGELLEQQVADAQDRLDRIKQMQVSGEDVPPPQEQVPVNPATGLPEGMSPPEASPQIGLNEAMGLQPPQQPIQETIGGNPPQPPTV